MQEMCGASEDESDMVCAVIQRVPFTDLDQVCVLRVPPGGKR